jgi:hypothetical protein
VKQGGARKGEAGKQRGSKQGAGELDRRPWRNEAGRRELRRRRARETAKQESSGGRRARWDRSRKREHAPCGASGEQRLGETAKQGWGLMRGEAGGRGCVDRGRGDRVGEGAKQEGSGAGAMGGSWGSWGRRWARRRGNGGCGRRGEGKGGGL